MSILKTTALAFVFTSFNAYADWDLNDVTYIFPLPTKQTVTASIRAPDTDSQGQVLLPLTQLKAAAQRDDDHFLTDEDILPRSSTFDDYQDLFMVSLRIDPCFRDQFTDICRKQIRAIWQPVDYWQENNPQTADAAVHTFFDLSDAEFDSFLKNVQSLKKIYQINTAGASLGLHPGFSASTITPFQKAFRELIIQTISAQRISRIAVMSLVQGTAWSMISANFSGGVATPLAIFNNGDNISQSPSNINGITTTDASGVFSKDDIIADLLSRKPYASASQEFAMGQAQIAIKGDQLLEIISNTTQTINSAVNTKSVLMTVARVEDPSLNLPGTVDCVSCHVSTAVKAIALKQLPGTASPTPKLPSRYNLKNPSSYYGNAHQLRMLGYLFEKLQVSDRTIFETASVADYLNNQKSLNR